MHVFIPLEAGISIQCPLCGENGWFDTAISQTKHSAVQEERDIDVGITERSPSRHQKERVWLPSTVSSIID